MNDYINQADALEACHPIMPTDGVWTIGLTYDEIKAMPPQDVIARISSEWIYEKELDMFRCDFCGDIMPRNSYPFCPWCGADMRKEETGGG